MTSTPAHPGIRPDDRRPPNDVEHTVIDGGDDETGWQITGIPDHLTWTPRDYAEQAAATFESQRLADIARRGDYPPTASRSPSVVYINAEIAKAALTEAAWVETDEGVNGRTLIHTFAGQGIHIGADWDLADALAFVDNAYIGEDGRARIAWVDDPFGHDLIVIASDTPGGERRQISFQVDAPEGTFR